MSRYANALGCRAVLLRLAMWIALALFAPLPAVVAADLADVGTIASRTDLLPYFAALETDKRDVAIERPGTIPGTKNFMTLRAKGAGPTFRWVAAGFTNSTTGARDMVIAIADQGFVGSGLYWPKPLGGHVESITTAGALKLQRLSVAGKEAYGFTLAPGQTGAIAFEIREASLSAVTLWQRNAFDDQKDYFAFFRGSLLGIAALLSIAMLALFGLRSRSVFLAASGFAVASVGFMLLEAGHLAAILELLALPALTPAVARAIIEGLMAVFLLLYLTTVSDVRRFVPILDHAPLLAGAIAFAIVAGSFADPAMASGVARTLFGVTALAGFLMIFFLWRQGNPKAETALVPWSAVLLWTFTALVAILANPHNTALSPALLVGLCGVLVVMVFALVHQAFSKGYLSQRFFREAGRRALALAGARAYVWDWQPEDVDLHVGDEIERALGLQPGLLADSGVGTFLDLMHPSDRSAYLAAVETAEEQGNGVIEQEFRLRHDDGDYRWFQLRGRGMPGSGDRAIRCIGTLTDVTDAKRSEERLLRNAVYDAVTGLPNRALFIDRAARALAAGPDTQSNVNIVLADIDRFKTVNDALGHEAGDSLLTVIARRLTAEVGPADTVGRLPGGQFAILVQGQEHNVSRFADSIRQAVARPVALDTEELFLTASIGIAQNREAGLSAEQLLKDATIALYEAKRRGNGATEIFRPAMRDHRAELVVLEAELRRAIQRNEIEVHYQPIARLADMNLAGFEALVRWRHPAMGLLAPESFVELAERTGLIKEIGQVVLNEAGRQLGIWQRSFRQAEPVFIAVNISPSQLVEPGLIEDVTQVLRREAVSGDSLKIEVTESLVMQYPELARHVLEQLKELGVGLCCDDFGTGHSSLSSLRKLPFDTLKIDRAFIAAEPDQRATVILEAIVAMAHALGLSIVAEGIENQEQVDRLGVLECDLGQGYFIGRPMTAKQVTDALAGLPYSASGGRTALTWLWERAAKDPVPEPATAEVTSASIHGRQVSHVIDRKIERDSTAISESAAEDAGASEAMLPIEPLVQTSTIEPEAPVSMAEAEAQASTNEPEDEKPSTPPLGSAPRAPRVPKPTGPIAVHVESPSSDGEKAKGESEESPKVRKRRRRRIPDDPAKRAAKKLQSTQH